MRTKSGKRLTSGLLAALLLTTTGLANVGTAWASNTVSAYNDPVKAWPSFTAYPDRAGLSYFDPANEPGISPDDVDFTSGALKGSGSLPSYYVGGNGTDLFFRFRLLGDPRDKNGGFLSSDWLVKVYANGSARATVGLNGKPAAEDYVYVANASGTVVRAVNKTDNTGMQVPGTRVTEDGAGNYFLDVQVPISRLTEIDPSITAGSVLQFQFASSKSANLSVINKDGMDAAGAYVKAAPFAVYSPTIAFSGLNASYAAFPGTISGTTSNAANNSPVAITIASASTSAQVATATATVQSNAWTSGALSSLPAGSYEVTATVTNENGDTAVTKQRVDVGAAKVTITGSSAYSTFTFPTTFAGTHDRSDNGQRRVNLKVYKLSGNPVVKTEVGSAMNLSVNGNNPGSWSSSTLTYTGLQPGYTYQVEASDSLSASVVATQRIAYLNGAVAITAPANNTRSTNAQPVVTGTATAGQTVSLYVDNVLYGTTVADNSGSWSMTLDRGLSKNANNTSYHVLKATITDEAGNTMMSSVNYGVDGYTISLENQSDPDAPEYVYATSLQPTIRGKSTDTAVNVTIRDAGTQAVVYSAPNTAVVNGAWSIQVPASTLSEGGRYAIQAVAVQDAAVTAYAYIQVKTATELAILSPANQSSVPQSTIVTGTAEPNAAVQAVLDDSTLVDVTADEDGDWSLPFPAAWKSGETHTVSVATADEAGNEANAGIQVTIAANPGPAAPTVTITEDANNDGYINLSELSGKADVSVSLPSTAAVGATLYVTDGVTSSSTVLTVSELSAGTVDTSYDAPANGSALTVQAYIEDAGEKSDVSEDRAVIDTEAPAIPTVNAQKTNDSTPTVTGTAVQDGLLEVELNGHLYKEGLDLTRSGTAWSLTVATPMADGTYSVAATLTDAAGNSTVDMTMNELELKTSLASGPIVMMPVTDSGISETDHLTNNGHPELKFDGQEGLSFRLKGPGGGYLTKDSHYSFDVVGTHYSIGLLDARPELIDEQPYGDYVGGALSGNPADTGDGTYTAEVFDDYGNSSVIGTFIIDTTPPEKPTVVKQTTSNPMPTVTGAAAEGGTLEVELDGHTYKEGVDLTRSGDSWSLQPSTSMADGTYPVTATLTDDAGNAAVDDTTNELIVSTAITVDNFALTAGTDTGRSQTDLLTKHGLPVIVFQGQSGLHVALKGPSGVALPVGQHYSVDEADGTYTVMLLDADLTDVGAQPYGDYADGVATGNSLNTSDGLYLVEVSDDHDNKVQVGSFEIDTTAPVVPTVESQTTNDPTPMLQGTALGTDEDELRVEVNGASYSESDGLTRAAGTWQLPIPSPLAAGTYPVTAVLTDAAGNASADQTTDELIVRTIQQDLQDAARDVRIIYSISDIWESVTLPVFLVKEGTHETVIGWTSSRPDVLEVTNQEDPDYPGAYTAVTHRQEQDVSLIVTAKIAKGGYELNRTFLLIVKGTLDNDEKTTVPRGDLPPVPQAVVTRTTLSPSNELVDKLSIGNNAMDQLLQNGGSDKLQVSFSDQPDGLTIADELAVEIPTSALLKVNNGTALQVDTPQGSLGLSAASVSSMQLSGNDLYFRIVPVRQSEPKQAVYQALIADSAVQTQAVGKVVTPLGVPKLIETNYAGIATELTLPLTDLALPNDPAQLQAYLQSLRVYVQHSDGTVKIAGGSDSDNYPAEIVYQGQTPVGIKFSVTHFSTFTLFRVEDAAPAPTVPVVVAPQPAVTLVSAKILDTRDELELKLSGPIASVDAAAFTVSVGGLPASVVSAKLTDGGTTIVLKLQQPIEEGYRVIATHNSSPLFKAMIDNSTIHKPYIEGYPDGQFKPERTITRAEIAAMLARLTVPGGRTPAQKQPFSDISLTHWAAEYIQTVKDHSIMNGYDDGSFKLERSITRAEMATVIARYLGVTAAAPKQALPFPDLQSHWAAQDVAILAELGIVDGENGLYHPDRNLTRAEAVTMINRALHRGTLVGGMQSWPDVPLLHWAYGQIEEASRVHQETRINPQEELWLSYPDQQ